MEKELHVLHIDEIPLYWRGLPLEKGPLPAFFFFALDAKRSLLDPVLSVPVHETLQGNKNVRIFSLDLPFHNKDTTPKESMNIWWEKLKQEEDFLSPFFNKCINIFHYLKEKNAIGNSGMAVGGISRGGFASFHLAARTPLISTVLAFSPLTEIPQSSPFTKHLNLENNISSLTGKTVRIHIGSRDEIVQTKSCFQFMQKLVEKNYKTNIKPAPVEMHIYPSIGYKGHGTTHSSFIDGAKWLTSKLD